MAKTGFHLSMGGKYQAGVEYAKTAGATTVQIFTHSPQSFSFKPVDENTTALRNSWKKANIGPVFSHCNYLMNLANTDSAAFYGSINTFQKELEYCNHFGCDYFVLHVGKHKEATLEQGMQQVAKGISKAKDSILKTKVTVLFETVAGQGTEIGAKFEDLHKLLEMFDKDVQPYIGVAIDTCHIFAAGYDLNKPDEVLKEIEKTFGLKRVKLIHVNDSKGELGSRLDRHERLGKGKIGLAGLKAFLTHPKIRDIPMILETPYETTDEQVEDLKILNQFFK